MSNSFKLHPKHFSKGGEKISCPPYLQACLLEGQLCPSSYTFLARQSYFSHLSQKFFAQRKEMTFDRRLKTLGLQFFLLILLHLSKSVKKLCMKSLLIVKACLILFLVSLVSR